MNFFQQPKPRGFQHHYLYVDERKERLRMMERRANAALARPRQEKQPDDAETRLRETFRRTFRHAHGRKRLSVATVLLQALLVVLLAFVVLWLLIQLKAQAA